MSEDEKKLKLKVEEYFEKYWSVSFEKFIENWEETSEALEYKDKEIERLKEEYVMLQNASDEVEEGKDKEIKQLQERNRKTK